MLDFNGIQEKVYEYGAVIDAPKELLKIFPLPQTDGSPYIQVVRNEYHYIVEERGLELEHRVTTNVDILLYWIMSDIVFNLANRYELKYRVEGIDNRRLLFNKKIELLRSLNLNWGRIAEMEVNEILKEAPYRDE